MTDFIPRPTKYKQKQRSQSSLKIHNSRMHCNDACKIVFGLSKCFSVKKYLQSSHPDDENAASVFDVLGTEI